MSIKKTHHKWSYVPAAEQSRCSRPQQTLQRGIPAPFHPSSGLGVVDN